MRESRMNLPKTFPTFSGFRGLRLVGREKHGCGGCGIPLVKVKNTSRPIVTFQK